MKKQLFFTGLFAVGVIGAGVIAYGNYGPVAAEREAETAVRSESGSIDDAALQAPIFPPKVNDKNGITVTVTPLLVSSDSATWEFDVVMSTHAEELGGYDLATLAILVDDAGKEYKPIAWKPDASEGHHIGGVLQFDRPTVESNNVTVIISGVGGPGGRVFEWQKQ